MKKDASDGTISTAAGALRSLSQSIIGKERIKAKVRTRRLPNSPSSSSTSSITSQVSDETHDDINGNHESYNNSRPTTPPMPDQVATSDDLFDFPRSCNINDPSFRTILTQFKALIGFSLSYLYPDSEWCAVKFKHDGDNASWLVTKNTESEKNSRISTVPPYPSNLKNEIARLIETQLVRRASVSSIDRASFERSPLKTSASQKHAPPNTHDDALPSAKRIRPLNSIFTSTTEVLHLRIAALESEVGHLRHSLSVMQHDISWLVKKLSTSIQNSESMNGHSDKTVISRGVSSSLNTRTTNPLSFLTNPSLPKSADIETSHS